MKRLYYILTAFLLCAHILSCGTARRLAITEERRAISSAYEQGDVVSLIEFLDIYPQYRGYVETYLFSYDYSKTRYKLLKEYSLASKDNTEVALFFDSILIQRQCAIIDSLSNLSLSEVGRFYKNNYIEHDYLRQIITDSYLKNIDSLDYTTVKSLYKAFVGSDLTSEVERPYRNLRDSLMRDIMGVLDPYFTSERELLSSIETAVRYQAQRYVEQGIEKIISAANEKNQRGIFKRIFQRQDIDNYSFSGYVNKEINEAYDYSYVDSLVKSRLTKYVDSSKQMRSMLFNQYFDDSKYQNIYISDDVLNDELVWVIGRDDISNIQGIKDLGTLLTVGSMALSFVPGVGAVAFVADVADLVYGFGQNEEVEHSIAQLAETIYNDSAVCIGDYISKVFTNLRQAQETTESNIRRIFNDDF
ncbi:MAG: hypothetical protein IJX65_05405 [Alistipes sp.]|nr:hypothetical protein [Alistipes sp.]